MDLDTYQGMLKLLFMKELECIVKSYEAYRQALLTELDTRKQRQQWYAQQPAKNFPPNMWLVWDKPKLQHYQCLSCWCRLSCTPSNSSKYKCPKRDTTQSLLGTLHYYSYIDYQPLYGCVCYESVLWFWLCVVNVFVHVRTRSFFMALSLWTIITISYQCFMFYVLSDSCLQW